MGRGLFVLPRLAGVYLLLRERRAAVAEHQQRQLEETGEQRPRKGLFNFRQEPTY